MPNLPFFVRFFLLSVLSFDTTVGHASSPLDLSHSSEIPRGRDTEFEMNALFYLGQDLIDAISADPENRSTDSDEVNSSLGIEDLDPMPFYSEQLPAESSDWESSSTEQCSNDSLSSEEILNEKTRDRAHSRAEDVLQEPPTESSTLAPPSSLETCSSLSTQEQANQALQEAVLKDDMGLVMAALTQKASVHQEVPDLSRRSLLEYASGTGNRTLVKALLNAGAAVNVCNPVTGTSPLMAAAENGRKANVCSLLKCGANLKVRNKFRQTALHLASQKGHTGLISFLLKWNRKNHRGLCINSQDKRGDTALHLAARNGNSRLFHILKIYGAWPYIRNNAKETPQEILNKTLKPKPHTDSLI
jgi:hypothetical protein